MASDHSCCNGVRRSVPVANNRRPLTTPQSNKGRPASIRSAKFLLNKRQIPLKKYEKSVSEPVPLGEASTWWVRKKENIQVIVKSSLVSLIKETQHNKRTLIKIAVTVWDSRRDRPQRTLSIELELTWNWAGTAEGEQGSISVSNCVPHDVNSQSTSLLMRWLQWFRLTLRSIGLDVPCHW